MSTTPIWEDRWPGRMQWELDALRAAGVEFEIDDEALSRRVLKLTFRHNADGTQVEGVATFPDLYPEFRPVVDAKPLNLAHHQNPFTGLICALGRNDMWLTRYSLAWLLTERVPLVLAAGRDSPDATTIEDEDVQAEPYSSYVPIRAGAYVLVDGTWVIPPEVLRGQLVLGTAHSRLESEQVRAAVLEVLDENGNTLAKADSRLAELFPHEHAGWWVRSGAPRSTDLPGLLDPAFQKLTKKEFLNWRGIPFAGKGWLRPLGILIPEEVAHRKSGQGWLFGVDARVRLKHGAHESYRYAADAQYAGPDDLMERIPELAPMRESVIAVFGLGSLGAPATLEFARAGARELRVLDGDSVEVGPTVRWPLGLQSIGAMKATVIADFITANYPYTKASAIPHMLGTAADGLRSDVEVLDEMLAGADLVFDATAELSVQRMLWIRAHERRIPYVSVVGRRGGWGGVVFRSIPGRQQGCWYCLQNALQEGGAIPDAPEFDQGRVQPRGCGDVTFTGTGFDMSTIALDAARRVIATLCMPSGGYPDGDWDVAVIALRNPDGSAAAPTWQTYSLPIDPACGCTP